MNGAYRTNNQRSSYDLTGYSSDEEETNPPSSARKAKAAPATAFLQRGLQLTESLASSFSLRKIQSYKKAAISLFQNGRGFCSPTVQWLITLSMFGIYTINKLAVNQSHSLTSAPNNTQLLLQPFQTIPLTSQLTLTNIHAQDTSVEGDSSYAPYIFGVSLLLSLPILLQACSLLPAPGDVSRKVKQFFGFKQPEPSSFHGHGFQYYVNELKEKIAEDTRDDAHTNEIPESFIQEERLRSVKWLQ